MVPYLEMLDGVNGRENVLGEILDTEIRDGDH